MQAEKEVEKEAVFQRADCWSERAGKFLMPEYQLKPGDKRTLNYVFTKQREALEKLDFLLKTLKDRDSSLFQSNGINLKKGEEFELNFNVKHIASIEEKQKKVSQETDSHSGRRL